MISSALIGIIVGDYHLRAVGQDVFTGFGQM
ncbi:MAG: hypothetical protein ACI9J5_003318 [Paraglaciecola sp.]